MPIYSNLLQLRNAKITEFIPAWIVGDALDVTTLCPGLQADFILSCPPYADMERYSDDPRDISNMPYEKFKETYFEIIKRSCALLKNDRFATFVVGEVRDSKGIYRNFVADTIAAFQAAGLKYYNEAILVNMTGSLPIRAAKVFKVGRKLGKCHQNALTFVKGDPHEAAFQTFCDDDKQLQSAHHNVLIFIKGNPQDATIACGEVETNETDDPIVARLNAFQKQK